MRVYPSGGVEGSCTVDVASAEGEMMKHDGEDNSLFGGDRRMAKPCGDLVM